MLNLIQHPMFKQGIPNQVRNDVPPRIIMGFRIKSGMTLHQHYDNNQKVRFLFTLFENF